MDEILYCACRCLYFNEKLIEQCDSWLSSEEGNKNMEVHIIERKKREKLQSKYRNSKFCNS